MLNDPQIAKNYTYDERYDLAEVIDTIEPLVPLRERIKPTK